MPRPSRLDEKRAKLLPLVARTFAELGYRRTTTAQLAERCRVRENILYRIWPSKKAMFLAAIEHVFELSAGKWQAVIDQPESAQSPAEKILEYEAEHHGEFGLYRIVFAGLSESDDPEIRAALRGMYSRFHAFIRGQMAAHTGAAGGKDRRRAASGADLESLAWAVVGLGTVANISREMRLLDGQKRRRLIADVGRILLRETLA